MGLARRPRRPWPGSRFVAVDAVASTIFGTPARAGRLPGIGASRVPEMLDVDLVDLVDLVVHVDEHESAQGCRRLAPTEGIVARTATCDLSGMSAAARREWYAEHAYPYGTWVADVTGRAVGWVALTRYDRKACFRRMATFSTYVDRAHRRQGVGGALRRHLIEEANRRGFPTLVNRVWVNNEASIGLARRYRFEEVGRMRDLVYRDGEYIDCVFFQLMLPAGPERPGMAGA